MLKKIKIGQITEISVTARLRCLMLLLGVSYFRIIDTNALQFGHLLLIPYFLNTSFSVVNFNSNSPP